MKTTSFSVERLLLLFKKQKIATISELKEALGSNCSMTVFRKLRELGYITSCSHSGKFYSLKGIKQKMGQLALKKQETESKTKTRKDVRLEKKIEELQKEIDEYNKELEAFHAALKEMPDKSLT